MDPITLQARKEAAWNSPAARQRRECAAVNEDAATLMLRVLDDRELQAHVELLQAEHEIKRHALRAAADALARALNEKWRRSHG